MASVILVERPHKSSFTDGLRKRYDVVVVNSGKGAVDAALTARPARTPIHAIILDALSMQSTGERIARASPAVDTVGA